MRMTLLYNVKMVTFFRKAEEESEKIFKSHVESEQSSSEVKDTR